jgi:flagellar biosynthesis/type III secretory pathway M-ring protein FliF/YscJ
LTLWRALLIWFWSKGVQITQWHVTPQMLRRSVTKCILHMMVSALISSLRWSRSETVRSLPEKLDRGHAKAMKLSLTEARILRFFSFNIVTRHWYSGVKMIDW